MFRALLEEEFPLESAVLDELEVTIMETVARAAEFSTVTRKLTVT